MSPLDDKTEVWLQEWKDCRDGLRYFGGKRFAQLTVFMTATGLLVGAHLQGLGGPYAWLLPLIGFLGTLLFVAMEVESVALWKGLANRAKEIEGHLTALNVHKGHRSGWALFAGTGAIFLLYAGALLMWWKLWTPGANAVERANERVERAIVLATQLSGGSRAEWNVTQLVRDPGRSTIQLQHHPSSRTLHLTIHADTGEILKLEATPITPPPPPAPPTAATYVVQFGDTLGRIARRLLGNADRWREIRELNREAVSGTDRILVGAVLRLPAK